ERIADFHEIRLERVDGARPAQWIERQAVVEGTGNQPALDGRNLSRLMRAAFTRNDDDVTPACVRAHPLVFGEQVTLHGTACGRKEERGIDDVHGDAQYRSIAVVR